MVKKKKKNQDLKKRQGNRRDEVASSAASPPRLPADTIILYCLYALVGLLPLAFIYQTYDIFELTKLTTLRLITLTMLGAWAWRIFRSRRVTVARTPIDWFVLAYLAVFSLATILSRNPRLSLLGDYGRFEGLLAILNYGAIFFLTGSLIRNNDAIQNRTAFLRSLVFTTVAAADIVSLYGVFQRFGIDYLTWSGAGTDLSRAFSTLGNPIYVAAYLTIILSLAVALFVSEHGLWSRVFLGASVSLLFASLVFTFSRAGWAGLLAALATMALLGIAVKVRGVRKIQADRATLAAVAILFSAIVIVVGISLTISSRVASAPTRSAIERALSSFNLKSPGVAERLYLWKSALLMVQDRPLLGWGPETFGTYYPKYRSEEFVRYEFDVLKRPKTLFQNRPHSDILQAGVSAGVLGLLVYVALWGGFFFFAIKRLLTRRPEPFEQALSIGIIGGLAGYLFQAQFSFGTIAVSAIVWSLMAVAFVVGERRESTREEVSFNLDWPKPVWMASLAGVFLLLALGAFFSARQLVADYYFDQGVTAMEIPDSYSAGLAFNQAISLNSYEPEYPNYAGNMFVEVAKASEDEASATGALSEAINYLDKAIALNPDMPGYHYNLGNAKYYFSMLPGMDKAQAEKTMKEALREYLFAAAADPLSIDVHLNLASAYMRFGQKEKAIGEIKEALKINPNNAAAKDALKKLEKDEPTSKTP